MYQVIHKALESTIVLKVLAICIGLSVWLLLGTIQYTTRDIVVPLCFYDIPAGAVLQAQEEITVRVHGTRNKLYALKDGDVVVHCNAHDLHVGTHIYRLKKDNFFLPSQVSMVHYMPSSCEIKMLFDEA